MTAISDRLLAVEARLDGAEARLLYLVREVSRYVLGGSAGSASHLTEGLAP